MVKVGELKNGSVNLIEVDTKAPVTPGEAISEGVKVKVIGNADYGYELASVKVEGANYNEADGSFMVGTGDVTVSASFQLVKYQITSALNNAYPRCPAVQRITASGREKHSIHIQRRC